MTDAKRGRVEIATRLAAIEKRPGGLTPRAVVIEAQNPKSPLHPMFEWNDSKAAHAHRLHQARMLIRFRYEITIENKTISAPLFIRDPALEPGRQGYVSLKSLTTNSVSAKAALRNEFRNAEAYLQRAREIALVLNLETYVDRIIARLQVVKGKAA